MPATKIKYTLKRLVAADDAAPLGPVDWKIDAKIKREATGETFTLGDPNMAQEAENQKIIDLDWSRDVPVEPKDNKFILTIKGTEVAVNSTTDVGSVEITLVPPIVHRYFLARRSSTGHYTAVIIVDIVESNDLSTGAGTTIVQNASSSTNSSLHDEMVPRLVHICPVIPVPWADGVPPVPRGALALTASPQYNFGIEASETKLNALINPAVIPVLDPSDPDFTSKCPRVGITQKRPRDLDASKFVWTVVEGNVKIWDGSPKTTVTGGEEIKVYATSAVNADEPVKIELRWDGPGKPLLATFLAWAGKIKYIWTRANIVKTSAATAGGIPIINPSTTPADIKAQIAYNNIILWQVGLQMAMDTDKTTYNGAIYKDVGIFEVTTAANHTFNIANNATPVCTILNSRNGVFNVGYMHTVANKPTLNGRATDRRLSAASDGTSNLSWEQSSSWIRATGVFPDDGAGTVTMATMGRSDPRPNSQKSQCGDGHIENVCGCLMTQQGATLPGSLTLAHELGHVLGLHHRGSGGSPDDGKSTDGMNHRAGPKKDTGHPWSENLLTYGANTLRQDLDWVQAQVIRSHALCKADPPPPPAPPPEKKPIPAQYHPTEADRILLQEYLIHKKPGLSHGPYNIGSTGPDGDGVDGVVGLKTRKAIRDFQRDHGNLTMDGIYGPKTKAAFEAEINAPAIA